MQSRLSTQSCAGSVAVDEGVVAVCEVCELSVLVLVPVFVLVVVVSVFVFVSVDEGVCCVDVSTVAATDAESVDCDWDREAVVAVGVGAETESVRTDDRVVVDAESTVRRCEPTLVEGVVVDARCVSADVEPVRVSSEVGSSAPPMDRLSGAVAAWVLTSDCWLIAETVRPPPTRATAVATTALRWFFLQRAR